MHMETKKKNIENDIESYLLNQGGYCKSNRDTYNHNLIVR